jgi:hypothetical protein
MGMGYIGVNKERLARWHHLAFRKNGTHGGEQGTIGKVAFGIQDTSFKLQVTSHE